ncbi:cell division protein ZapA [Bacteroides gallinaceum]|uniref:cell division protein ZapA n=1 Tax=Bacteroides gallinaceum TaxID=1462571 RepID=UPI0015B046F1|nr:cell division protein ZapA [Bacteroides gallinaceum]MDM8154271.1 cell division protein ZapA [Bacteroides gallinaceum]
MEDGKLKIHLRIDNGLYPLVIDREKEELYRKAAKQIDYKLNKYRSMYPEFSPTRHWAMAALELSFENVAMKDRNDTRPYAEKLKQLSDDIDGCIHPAKPDGE